MAECRSRRKATCGKSIAAPMIRNRRDPARGRRIPSRSRGSGMREALTPSRVRTRAAPTSPTCPLQRAPAMGALLSAQRGAPESPPPTRPSSACPEHRHLDGRAKEIRARLAEGPGTGGHRTCRAPETRANSTSDLRKRPVTRRAGDGNRTRTTSLEGLSYPLTCANGRPRPSQAARRPRASSRSTLSRPSATASSSRGNSPP
jgi:hypothetical protein